jgi:hypothetical protein
MKSLAYALALACAVLTGCATYPYPAPEPFAADGGALAEVPARFAARLAPRFEQVNAIIFSFKMQKMTALGVASVDVPTRSFAVTCMTPIGVKLFDVVCTQGVAEGRFVHPEFAKRGGDLAQVVAADLMRAYFDGQPVPEAPFQIRRGRLVFTSADATGVTEHRYAWSDGRLAEKVRLEKGRRLWTIAYREYASCPDGLVPSGMEIVNHLYGYRLVVAARE